MSVSMSMSMSVSLSMSVSMSMSKSFPHPSHVSSLVMFFLLVSTNAPHLAKLSGKVSDPLGTPAVRFLI